jgi:hypothetical protein
VNNEIGGNLLSENRFFDKVYLGFSIKYFRYDYSNFNFALIRGTHGKFYYIGFTDDMYNKNAVSKFYKKDTYNLKRIKDSLYVIKNTNTREVILINQILIPSRVLIYKINLNIRNLTS